MRDFWRRRSWKGKTALAIGSVFTFLFLLGVALGEETAEGPSASSVAGTTSASENATSAARTAKPEPAKPKGYQALFASSMTPKKAAAPLCSTYRRQIAGAVGMARRLMDESTSSLYDPYEAAEYTASATWLHAHHPANFERRLLAAAKTRLLGVVGNDAAVTPTMVQRFLNDSLWLCRQLSERESAERALERLVARAAALGQTASEKPWYPRGWNEYSANIAWRWVGDPTCDYEGASCWQIEILSQNGCPSSVYAELQIMGDDGAVVDFSNDSLGSLEAQQLGRLTFNHFGDDGQQVTGRISEINCY